MSAKEVWCVGDHAIWLYEARGGYGYTQRVKAIVERVGPRRITIRVRQIHSLGVEREVVKSVTPQRLVRPT